MENVLLNGVLVNSDKIDPRKHKFIGTFRTPSPPDLGDVGYCPQCSLNFIHEGIVRSCWQAGHLDIPQYITIIPYDIGFV